MHGTVRARGLLSLDSQRFCELALFLADDQKVAAGDKQALNRVKARARLDDKSPLALLFKRGLISEAEYLVGDTWRGIYLHYLASIGAPSPYGGDVEAFTQADCKSYADDVKKGNEAMDAIGRRTRHAVNAIAVYEDPEELGNFELTARAAQKGLAALVLVF